MDAVMFEMKAAHLTVQRVGRRMLRRFGITPARFDLMNSLGTSGMKQSDLWRRLHVVRSVVCEMVRALQELGWVERVRAADDSRTWLVRLTRFGRELFERAYAACVESGDATLIMDRGLSYGHVEIDALDARNTFVFECRGLSSELVTSPSLSTPSLYCWNPEDYYFHLIEPGEPVGLGGVPFVEV